jgi:trk system potassium uptake protein TrkA
VLVCAVLRDGEAIAPKGNFVLREDDRIFVTAPTENLTLLLKNLGIIQRRARKVMICGGGGVGYYLASMLLEDGIGVCIIEKDAERCRELCELLPKATVICGDGTDQSLLDSEGIASYDALVTMTGVDELNMIVSLYGNAKGVPSVVTKLSRIDNHDIINDLDLGSVIWPKELCTNTILRYVRAMQNQSGAAISVHSIADGNVEAIEFLVDENTLHCGEQLKAIKLRENVLIASITKGTRSVVPNGNSTFHVGDTIVVVTNGRGVLRQLNDIFD